MQVWFWGSRSVDVNVISEMKLLHSACSFMDVIYTRFVFLVNTGQVMSRDSAVGIATGSGLDDREVVFRVPVRGKVVPVLN
jgi:hypothetical protein